MTCHSGKIGYATRSAALAAQKQLVFDNHVRNRSARSAGLNVYPCPMCPAWHIGHARATTPSCYHYDICEALDDVLAAGALKPPKPTRLDPRVRRRLDPDLLVRLRHVEELAAFTWFTWDGAWDFAQAPHPGGVLHHPVSACRHLGILRIEVPAAFVRLRWSDYVERNRVTRTRRAYFTTRGNPAQWLASGTPVPVDVFRSVAVWYRDAWVALDAIDPEGFDAWLATQSVADARETRPERSAAAQRPTG